MEAASSSKSATLASHISCRLRHTRRQTRQTNCSPVPAPTAVLMAQRREMSAPKPDRHLPGEKDYGYHGNGNDKSFLRLPSKTKLSRSDVTEAFAYARNLTERYDIQEVIGTGSFGTVHRAVDRSTGQPYACKSIPKVPKHEEHTTPHALLKIRSEVDIMSRLGSSLDAVFLVAEFEDDTHVHIVMELCDGGNLVDTVVASDSAEADVALAMRSVFRFLALCHSKDIIYRCGWSCFCCGLAMRLIAITLVLPNRDVKPENFLFTSNSTLKATDFGLAIQQSDPPLTLAAGTPVYIAPEVFARCYWKPCDIYSAGVLAFRLLTGRYPYWPTMEFGSPSLAEFQDIVMSSNIDFSHLGDEGVSETGQAFLKQVLAKDPSLRITAAEALRHPWIKRDDATEARVPLEGTAVQRLQRYAVYSHLKQKALAMISEEILAAGEDADQDVAALGIIKPLRSLFQLMTVPGNRGSAAIRDIVNELQREGYCLSDAETGQLLESLDTDHDGLVRFSDFAASLLDWDLVAQTPKWEGLVRRAFGQIAPNNEGGIGLEEAVRFLERTGWAETRHAAEEEAAAMIRDFDTDYDGSISWEEFYACLSEDCSRDLLDCFDKRQQSSPQKETKTPRAHHDDTSSSPQPNPSNA